MNWAVKAPEKQQCASARKLLRIDPRGVGNLDLRPALKHLEDTGDANRLALQFIPGQSDFIAFYSNGVFLIRINTAHVEQR